LPRSSSSIGIGFAPSGEAKNFVNSPGSPLAGAIGEGVAFGAAIGDGGGICAGPPEVGCATGPPNIRVNSPPPAAAGG